MNKLGISKGNKYHQQSDIMVELLLRAIHMLDKQLDHKTIKAWHQLLFPTQPLVTPMAISEYRHDQIQILSGRYGKQQLHYQAPEVTSQEVKHEMDLFYH